MTARDATLQAAVDRAAAELARDLLNKRTEGDTHG